MIAKSTSQNVANFNYLPNFLGPFFKTFWRLLHNETNVLLSKTCRRPAELHLAPRRQWWPGLREAVSGKYHKAPHFKPGFSRRNFGDHLFGGGFHHFFVIVAKNWNGKKRLATLHPRPADLDMKPWNPGCDSIWNHEVSVGRISYPPTEKMCCFVLSLNNES